MDERNPRTTPRTVHCRVCTIIIGEGYEETYPIPLPSGQGFVCWRCYESLQRQAQRRAADREADTGGRRR